MKTQIKKQILVSPHATDNGEAVEPRSALPRAISYIPYGEIFVEQQSGGWQSPYLFNSKELDSETGLYYYGARYLDPTSAAWLSVDPLWEKYVGMSPYNYCMGNPVGLVDVDGMGSEEAEQIISDFLQKDDSKSVFPNVSKEKFCEDLSKIVSNPESINQADDGVCGAAVLSKIWAEDSPTDFVNACISLYENGSYSKDGEELYLVDGFKNRPLDKMGPNVAATMMMHAITNWNNFFFDFTGGSNFFSFNWPHNVAFFAQHFMGKEIDSYDWATLSDLQSIDYSKSYVIAGCNTSNYGKKFSASPIPTHYVQIVGVNGNEVSYWQWGQSTLYKDKIGSWYNGIQFLINIHK